MEYFSSLPEEEQKKAWSRKRQELLDSWYDSYISEIGDELDNYVEETLLRCLDEDDNHIEKAKAYYAKECCSHDAHENYCDCCMNTCEKCEKV